MDSPIQKTTPRSFRVRSSATDPPQSRYGMILPRRRHSTARDEHYLSTGVLAPDFLPSLAFLLPHTTSKLPPTEPCHRLQIRPPRYIPSKPSSTQLWTSMPDALDKISATTHWPLPSIDAGLQMRFLLYSKHNPRHSMNSGMAIPS